MCCLCDVTTASVLPAYIWPLSYIFNDTIAVTPPMSVHGGVKKMASGGSGLEFDGTSGWIEAGDFSGMKIPRFSSSFFLFI